ncbi:MAG: FecR domain-containing protein [Deltaproteobacteria bacterium]|nr:FecR domain-containing protein [Deltaproteobacteria bacterium]MBN2670645.1 FecR domain-containing protein [Deltaproteobacteria bacterium]
MKQYETLLRDVARQEDDQVAATFDHEAARAQFIMKLTGDPPKRTTGLLKFSIIAAAAVLGIAITATVYFQVFTPTTPGLEPQWVQVGSDDSHTLKFEDGTRVRFNENSTGRVAQLAVHEGEVTLESGRVDLKVTHTDQTDWHVLAGPYRVAVTGTQFEVKWNPQESQLQVDVFEGSVLVTGPMLENGHAVIANRSLTANPTTSNVQLSSMADARDTDLQQSTKTPQEAALGTDDEKLNAVPGESKEKVSPATKSRSVVISTAWISEAKAGNYSAVSKTIKSHGLQRMLSGASPSTYLLLSNAARQAKDFNTAEQVYEQLRKVYPGSGHAATAALYLGRMAFDQQHQYPAAVKWFNIYLNEQKSGTLHRETLGRLMEAQFKSNMGEAAKQTAKRYLEQYPNGPHSIRAKELSGP